MKRQKLRFFVIFFLFSCSLGYCQGIDIMPLPRQYVQGTGKFRINEGFSISPGLANDRVCYNAERALRRLSGRTGIFFRQDSVTVPSAKDSANFFIECARPGDLRPFEDESYSLEINTDKIVLSAKTDLGVIHGLETLLASLKSDHQGYYFPCASIKDSPRFTWRGLMLDVARHFMPIDLIKRNLEAMAAVKMNVLHLHLSDDQGVKVESKIYPRLQKFSSGGPYFTQAEIKEIIFWASRLGIRVIPEFDVPGHAEAWFAAYPELASIPGSYKVGRDWGTFHGVFNPASEETYKFLDGFFSEMASLFPDQYFHIGGDENDGKAWDMNPEIQNFMKKNGIKDNAALQAYFNERILRILTSNGKKMIGWDEILYQDMPKNIVIQSWRGPKSLSEAASKGYMGILSNGYYIDLFQHTDFHYLNDPIPSGTKLTEAEQKLILGGEATMWSELTTPEIEDGRIWPRTAAIAERLWSDQSVRDLPDMFRRLSITSFRLEELGLTHIKNYGMMLRRLSGGRDFSSLKVLADVSECVKEYSRHSYGLVYKVYSPYTRFVDALDAESDSGRNFGYLVDSFLKERDNKTAAEITRELRLWAGNDAAFKELAEQSPILREVLPLSKNLAELSVAGLEAISVISFFRQAKPEAKVRAEESIKEAKKSYGQAELAVLPHIEKLIRAAYH